MSYEKMKKVGTVLLGDIAGALMAGFWKKLYNNISTGEDSVVEKLNSYYDTLNGWLRFKYQGKSLEDLMF